MKKFFIHSTFVVAFVLLNISVYAVDGGIVSGPPVADGTEENPYLISSENDFVVFMNGLLAGKNYENTFFLQTCDIIFNNGSYYNGSKSPEKFQGVYDGGGHTISFTDGNTLIKNVDKVGLFTYADGATIKNLTLYNLTIDAKGHDYVGFFVGLGEGITMENCKAKNCTIINGGNDVGGLVGYTKYGGTFINCSVSKCTIRGFTVGGLIGEGKDVFIYNCETKGNNLSGSVIGGFAGLDKRFTIIHCTEKGSTITGTSGSAMVGRGDDVELIRCSASIISGCDDIVPDRDLCTSIFSSYYGNNYFTISNGEGIRYHKCYSSYPKYDKYEVSHQDYIDSYETIEVYLWHDFGQNISYDDEDVVFSATNATLTEVNRVELKYKLSHATGNVVITAEYKPSGIVRTPITGAVVSDVAVQEYTGKAITPNVTVTLNGKTLSKGKDYAVLCENNINAGVAKIKIIGRGYYDGYVEKSFTIAPKPITLTVADKEKRYGKDDPKFTYKVTSLCSDDELSGVTFQRESGEDPGSYAINALVDEKANPNYIITCIPGTLTIHNTTHSGALTIYDYGNYATATIDGNYNGSIPFNLDNDLAVASVTFEREFTRNRYSTIMLPFDVPNPSACGKFYTFSGVQYVNGQWEAQVVETSEVKANTPYIFYPSSSKPPLTDGVTKLLKTEGTLSQDNANGNWTLKGMYNYYQWPTDAEKDYGFAGKTVSADNIEIGQFIKVGAESWINPFRCYLTYNGNSTDLSKSTVILPDCIIVRVVEPDEIPSFQPVNNEIITPITEITPESAVKVWSYNKTIIIESQPYTNYTIVDLTGRILKTGVTHSTHEEVSLNCNTGIVIVNINGKTFKINY